MNRFLKWIIAGIGIIAVLLVITAVVLPFVVDPNDYKDQISKAVNHKTGREFNIGGDIEWTVFPWIGLTVSDVELGNRDGLGERPMVAVGAASASVKLLPLFSRKIEVSKVILNDTAIYLRRRADGRNNWEDLAGSGTPAATSAKGRGAKSLMISGVEINNANVTWHDADQLTELTGFGLQVSNIEPGRAVDVEGGFAVNLSQPKIAGDAEFGGQIQTSSDSERYRVGNLVFAFSGNSGEGDAAAVLDLAISADADIDLDSGTARLADFLLRFHDLSLTGDLDVSDLLGQPRMEGKLRVAEFSPRALLKAMDIDIPSTASGDVLKKLAADMRFTGTANTASMQDLTVRFDQSTAVGNLQVDNFDNPRLAFDFRVDTLNLDDYLSPAETEDSGDLTAADFQGFTGGGDFRIGTLVFAGLTATDVSLTLSSSGEGIRLFPVTALFYGGDYTGDIRINASRQRPLMTTTQTLSGVQALGLLEALTGSAVLEGLGDLQLDLRSDLTNAKAMRRTLTGKTSMVFKDGAILGINIAESIRAAQSALGLDTGPETETTGDPKTDFSELSVTGVIDKGVVKSNDFKMQSPLLRVTGKGQLNLPDETVDVLLEPVLVASLEGQGGKGLDQLAGVPIPIRLSGSLHEPAVKVDIAAALTGSQKAVIDKKKDELAARAFEKLFGDDDAAESGDDPASTSASAQTGDNTAERADDAGDSPEALLDSLLGGSRDKDRKGGGRQGQGKKTGGEEDDDPDDGG